MSILFKYRCKLRIFSYTIVSNKNVEPIMLYIFIYMG